MLKYFKTIFRKLLKKCHCVTVGVLLIIITVTTRPRSL